MNLAILHYHLNRGGVAQVIANHLGALATAGTDAELDRVAVVYGGRRAGWPDGLLSEIQTPASSLHEIPTLDYDSAGGADPAALAQHLLTLFRDIGFTPEMTVVHAHNHALGKNTSLPGALTQLARTGYALLLQIHDFAEDFRPDNYRRLAACLGSPTELPATLYPQSAHIHYAVLNRRDREILSRAGVHGSNLHVLPNPVRGLGALPSRARTREVFARRFGIPTDRRFVLYPVRCIRRKNTGEALLWSALSADEAGFGFTLPPLNPAEQPAYRMWKDCAARLNLPCFFEVGAAPGIGFADCLAAADQILTTSVAEGFGLVFLESWLAERPLIGRDLPEITSDFVAAGVRLDSLSPTLAVPVDWIGHDTYCEAVASAYRQVLRSYDRPLPPATGVEERARSLVRDGLVDFSTLGSRLQERLIGTVCSRADRRDRVHELNPWITEAIGPHATGLPPTIQQNAAAVRRGYSLETCGRTLQRVYSAVAASPRDSGLGALERGETILESFLDLSRFHPIRVESSPRA